MAEQNPADLWEAYARVYDRLAEHYPLYAQLVEDLGRRVEGCCVSGGRILDAGCGTGTLAFRLARHGRVVGIDATEAMLARAAAKRATASDLPRFLRADLTQPLPFRDGRFDLVTCIHVLYALPDPRQTLLELARVLVPGGTLVTANMSSRISVPAAVREILSLYGIFRGLRILGRLRELGRYNRRLARQQDAGEMHYWSREAFRDLLDECGFTLREHEYTYTCRSDLVAVSVRR